MKPPILGNTRPQSKPANLTSRQADQAVDRYLKGRRAPYTERGIRRVPCARCGKPSHHQWNICALGGRHLGICVKCDVGLNRAALEFMGVPNAAEIIEAYARLRGISADGDGS